jgi:hypothetical protein
MTRKFVDHIKNEAYVDFVKEAKAILDAEHEKQVREYTELLLRTGHLTPGTNKQDTEKQLEEALTRKHFKMAADSLKSIEDKQKRKEMAAHHAEIFAKSNPRFNRAKFMQAADVEDDMQAARADLNDMADAEAVAHQSKKLKH